MLNFTTKLFQIKDWTILHLPPEESANLPTRGMLMVEGTLNGVAFKTLLEPDGVYGDGKKPSHWFRPEDELLQKANVKAGDIVKISLRPTKDWVEPELPQDVKDALIASSKAYELWKDITPLARWDWIRWIRAVKTPETRQKHIEIMLSKLNKGMRRPCCFNRNLCSEPYISKKWALIT